MIIPVCRKSRLPTPAWTPSAPPPTPWPRNIFIISPTPKPAKLFSAKPLRSTSRTNLSTFDSFEEDGSCGLLMGRLLYFWVDLENSCVDLDTMIPSFYGREITHN